MPQVPTSGEAKLSGSNDSVKDCIIYAGGSPTGDDIISLRNAANFSKFDPAFLAGASSLSQITSLDQFRGYPVSTTYKGVRLWLVTDEGLYDGFHAATGNEFEIYVDLYVGGVFKGTAHSYAMYGYPNPREMYNFPAASNHLGFYVAPTPNFNGVGSPRVGTYSYVDISIDRIFQAYASYDIEVQVTFKLNGANYPLDYSAYPSYSVVQYYLQNVNAVSGGTVYMYPNPTPDLELFHQMAGASSVPYRV